MQAELLAIRDRGPWDQDGIRVLIGYLVAAIGIQRALIEALAPILDHPTDS